MTYFSQHISYIDVGSENKELINYFKACHEVYSCNFDLISKIYDTTNQKQLVQEEMQSILKLTEVFHSIEEQRQYKYDTRRQKIFDFLVSVHIR
jgi:hypothetical protein